MATGYWSSWVNYAKEKGKSTVDFVRHDLQEFTNTTGDALKQTSHAFKDTVITTGSKLKDITSEKDVSSSDASNSAHLTEKKGWLNLQALKSLGPQGPLTTADDSGSEQYLLLSDSDGHSIPLAPLAAAERNLIAQSDTFLVRPKVSPAVLSNLNINVEGTEEERLWNGFVASYNLEVAERREHIAQLLANNPSIRALYNNSVPSQLGHHDFWLHYMYRREELRVRMQQREKLKQRAETVPVNADHPTVDWDDDWESGASTSTILPPASSEVSVSALAAPAGPSTSQLCASAFGDLGTPPPLSLLCSAVASKLCLQESQCSLASEAAAAAPPQASPSTASSSDPNESTLNETSFRERLARSDLPFDVAAAAAASTATPSSAVSGSVSPTSELHVEAVGHARASTSSTIAGEKSGQAETEGEAVMVGEVLRASPGGKSSSSSSSSAGSEHSEGSGQRASVSVSASYSVLDSSSVGGAEPPEAELESPVPEASDLEWPGDEPSSDSNGGTNGAGATNGGPKRAKSTPPPAGAPAPADASAAASSSARAKPETANATHSKPPDSSTGEWDNWE